MSKPKGTYTSPFTWLVHSSPTKDAHGRPIDVWTDSGILWCRLDNQSSSEGEKYGGERSRIQATIFVNQMPNLNVQDRLTDLGFGELWKIESFYRDNYENELVVSAYREPEPA